MGRNVRDEESRAEMVFGRGVPEPNKHCLMVNEWCKFEPNWTKLFRLQSKTLNKMLTEGRKQSWKDRQRLKIVYSNPLQNKKLCFFWGEGWGVNIRSQL